MYTGKRRKRKGNVKGMLGEGTGSDEIRELPRGKQSLSGNHQETPGVCTRLHTAKNTGREVAVRDVNRGKVHGWCILDYFVSKQSVCTRSSVKNNVFSTLVLFLLNK